jgi:ABC-2 type transport system permease protein
MISALLYLQWFSLRNQTVARIKRLRQPKYLLGAIVGGLYFYFYFVRHLFSGSRPAGQAPFLAAPENLLLLEGIGATVLFILTVLAWLIPHQRAALTFSEAEVAFLFPAPISRRDLIHYKLLRSQAAILFTILILTLLSNQLGGRAWIHALGWWIAISTLTLHSLGASFARTQLLDRGITNTQRRLVVLALATAAVAAVLFWARGSLPGLDLTHIDDLASLKSWAISVFGAGPAPYVLFPFKILVKPYLAADAPSFAKTIAPALLLMGLHYRWVIRANVAFEEASVDASRKLAERIAAVRSGNWQAARTKTKPSRPPFRLKSTGAPFVALFWKNLISARQAFSARMWITLAIVVVAIGIGSGGATGKTGLLTVAGAGAAGFAVWMLLIGPQLFRQDLRQDLVNADLLKLYPLKGWEILLGEILAPASVMTLIQWLLLAVSLGFLVAGGQTPLSWPNLFAVALGIALVLPGLNLISIQIPNAAVLLFPAWFQPGKENVQGIEATGQRLILFLGQCLVFVAALIPAGAGAVLIYWLTMSRFGIGLGFLAGAVVAVVILAAEAALTIRLLGSVFERFDLSEELNK